MIQEKNFILDLIKEGLIDCRSKESFIEKHIKGSACLSIDNFEERAHEWPAPGNEVNVVINDNIMIDFLNKKNFKIKKSLIANDELWKEIEKMDLLEKGWKYVRFWLPNPLLNGVIEEVENIREKYIGQRTGVAIDIACGSGRDILFLAERNWKILGIDYLDKQLIRVNRLIDEMMIKEDDVRLINMNIEENDNKHFENFLKNGICKFEGNKQSPHWLINENKLEEEFTYKFDLVVISRYLHRPHYETLKNMIKKGGFILFHTFLEGCESVGKKSPKKPRFILKFGELAKVFSESSGWKIYHDSHINLEDGRPISYFVAMKL